VPGVVAVLTHLNALPLLPRPGAAEAPKARVRAAAGSLAFSCARSPARHLYSAQNMLTRLARTAESTDHHGGAVTDP